MLGQRPDPVNFLWAQADPTHLSTENYTMALRDLGRYLAKNLPEDIRNGAIPPLNEEVKRELILGDFTSNKPVKKILCSLLQIVYRLSPF